MSAVIAMFCISSMLTAIGTPMQDAWTSCLSKLLLILHDNQTTYLRQIPSVYCDEHVVSQMSSGGNHSVSVTDSIFHLTRTTSTQNSSSLSEMREVTAVNGSSARGVSVSGPMTIAGVFSHGLNVVSSDQERCTEYAQDRPQPPSPALIITFRTKSAGLKQKSCLLKEDSTGSVTIDAHALQVVSTVITFPHHNDPMLGDVLWTIAVSYAPVRFDQQLFWLPQTITSTAISTELDGRTTSSFVATYSNYHKLVVHSHVVVASGSSPGQ